jgi:hypothetical protein
MESRKGCYYPSEKEEKKMNTYLVYLAGPIGGCSYGECTNWREYFCDLMERFNVECISPMRGKSYLKNEGEIDKIRYETPLSCPKGVYTRDRFDAMRCDLLIVNLLGAKKPSLGSVMEIAWADAVGTPIIIVMEPEDNCHEHILIQEACEFRVDTLELAADLAVSILNLQGE